MGERIVRSKKILPCSLIAEPESSFNLRVFAKRNGVKTRMGWRGRAGGRGLTLGFERRKFSAETTCQNSGERNTYFWEEKVSSSVEVSGKPGQTIKRFCA